MSSEPAPSSDEGGLAERELIERLETLEQQVATLTENQPSDRKRLAIIATKGSLDMAYPPLILATTAAAFDWEVEVFYTFWGLDILHRKKSQSLTLSAVGNTSMPIPNSIAVLPGMDRVTTRKMEQKIADNGTPTIKELIDIALDQGVDLQACQMTMDLMDYDDDDFFDGVTTGVGAASALEFMGTADVQLLI